MVKGKMCKAFSCIITKNKKCYWKLNLDSHESLIDNFKLKEDDDTYKFVRVEVAPRNNNYLKPDKWVFKIDEENMPDWFSPSHKEIVMKNFRLWKKQLYTILVRKKIVNPFKFRMVKKVSVKHVLLLKDWASIRCSFGHSVMDSVGYSVRDSVGYSVRDSVEYSVEYSVRDSVIILIRNLVGCSVMDSVGYSVRDSVGYSVMDSVEYSVWAYIGSFFKLERKQWKYTDKIKTRGYPFQSMVDLWDMGLVPSFDGTTWRLHSGEKASIVFSINQKDLKKFKKGDKILCKQM
jgi:hypothetical protein